MHVDRFVRTELVPIREQPFVHDLATLLDQAGLSNSSQERLWVIAYDSIEQVRTIQEVAVGGYHEMAIPLPALLTSVLLSGTDRFMVAHNHPSGDVSPTNLDVDMTHTIMDAANVAGLFFEDHLIVGPGGRQFSFVENGLLKPAPETLEMAGGRRHRRAPRTAFRRIR